MNFECEECATIIRELQEAYSEALADADDKTREAWAATCKMMTGQSEWDDEQVRWLGSTDLAPRLAAMPPVPARAARALRAALVHIKVSGHKFLLRSGF